MNVVLPPGNGTFLGRGHCVCIVLTWTEVHPLLRSPPFHSKVPSLLQNDTQSIVSPPGSLGSSWLRKSGYFGVGGSLSLLLVTLCAVTRTCFQNEKISPRKRRRHSTSRSLYGTLQLALEPGEGTECSLSLGPSQRELPAATAHSCTWVGKFRSILQARWSISYNERGEYTEKETSLVNVAIRTRLLDPNVSPNHPIPTAPPAPPPV